MAIFPKAYTLIQQRKRQQILLIIFAAVLLITLIVLSRGFFKKPSAPGKTPVLPQPTERKVDIGFDFFESELFKQLGQPLLPPKIPDQVGRENPFLEL